MGIRWSLLSREALKSSVNLGRAVARQWPLRKPDILYHFVLTLQSQTFGHAELQKRGYIIDDKGGKGERIHWILQSWSYHLKINFFKDIKVTPERGCSRRQLVRHYYASSARRNNRVDPLKRIPCTIYWKPQNWSVSHVPLPQFQSIFLCVIYRHFICLMSAKWPVRILPWWTGLSKVSIISCNIYPMLYFLYFCTIRTNRSSGECVRYVC